MSGFKKPISEAETKRIMEEHNSRVKDNGNGKGFLKSLWGYFQEPFKNFSKPYGAWFGKYWGNLFFSGMIGLACLKIIGILAGSKKKR